MISIAQLRSKLHLVECAISINVCLLDELLNISITNLNVQVLGKNVLYFIHRDLVFFLIVKQLVHVIDFSLLPFSEKPLFTHHLNNIRKVKRLLRLVDVILNFLLYFLHVHLSKPKVTKYTSHLRSINITRFLSVVEVETIFYFIFLFNTSIPFLPLVCRTAIFLS